MAATIFARAYRVVGRAVLGVTESGSNYYWNEYYLETAGGDEATLVFEETARGGVWRFFTMFDPENPITAEDAATKRPGDPLNLDGTPLFVTRVDQSRVFFTEGKMPEGVKVGQLAKYFNAEAGDRMIVVSWTGDEVECYSGERIRSRLLAGAFNLQGWSSSSFVLLNGRRGFNRVFLVPVFVLACFGFVLTRIFSNARPPRRPPAAAVFNAPAFPLPLGATGVLQGAHYQITGRALVEFSEVGLRLQRHQFSLRDDDGAEVLLLDDPRPTTNWFLCAPLHPEHTLTPQQAGNLGRGQAVNLDGRTARVTELFRCAILQSEAPVPGGLKPGDVFYGFIGPMGSDFLLARWNERSITWYAAAPLPASAVLAAFGPSAEK
ncbi:MAG: DUF4178 domain-containing protein [Verrucomicrobiota bacterium]